MRFLRAQLNYYILGVTLSEPPRRNGGESNGSLPRRARIGYSSCCQTNCIQLPRYVAKDFSTRLRSVEMTQGGMPLCEPKNGAAQPPQNILFCVFLNYNTSKKACLQRFSDGTGKAERRSRRKALVLHVSGLNCKRNKMRNKIKETVNE